MGGRSGWTRQASHLITDPVDTVVALLEAGASSVGAGAGAVVSPEVSATCGDEVGGIAAGAHTFPSVPSVGGGDRGYGGSRFESRSGGYGGSRDYYSRWGQRSCRGWGLVETP